MDFSPTPEMFSFILVALQNHETIPVYSKKYILKVILLNKINIHKFKNFHGYMCSIPGI